MMEQVKIVHIYETKVWIESDAFGGRHVVMQHETCEPFTYCSFNYDYAYTSNAGTHAAATEMALSLGAKAPVEERSRPLKWPTKDEIREQIAGMQELLNDDDGPDETGAGK